MTKASIQLEAYENIPGDTINEIETTPSEVYYEVISDLVETTFNDHEGDSLNSGGSETTSAAYRRSGFRVRDAYDHVETTDVSETIPNEVYGVSTDVIETTPNEVYGVSADGIETTPNEVYRVSTDVIETTPNEVYGVSADGIKTTPN